MAASLPCPTKALRSKSGDWLHITGILGGNKLMISTLPQLMAETSTRELIDQAYDGLIDWEQVELVELEIAVSIKQYPDELVDGYVPIYRIKMDKDRFGLTEEGAMRQELAEEYAVCADQRSNAGLIIYGEYNGIWSENPWSSRFLVRDLLEKIGITIPIPSLKN